ncbi:MULTISPECIES: IclR family transcriptional regulator C-terminal domain-containing protein [unclassified Achromobacter]|uniref:IclR family transcriptional regulator domain-containing protein n=1 Tax=unclassified Achromobacter TaxID=2626865 RepID=UPI00069E0468|nr:MULTISPECIES: IclR family transcriptional regulator C-terminal domain-containing protein [unclassified Achromobacter]KOF53040.1 IclR family transcriptional regulator [Achromobacter sp. DMS1]KOF53470.1 IclR family transcriptional regulator [Achromobacter sp. DMS1]
MLPTLPPPGYAAPLAEEDHPDRLRGDPDYMLTLARGLHVIRAFGTRRHPQTAADLSRRAGLPRAVVQRCLHTLTLLGVAERHGRHYVLTPRILNLGYAYFSSTPLVSLAQPVLDELSATVNETCALAVLESHEILYLARSEVHRILATSMGLGSRLPAYCTSIGRAVLAHLSEAALDRYFAAVELKPYTEFTEVNETRLRAELARVREQGYAVVDQELELNVRAISVPVRSASGAVCGAVNVSVKAARVPTPRLAETFLPPMRQAVERIGELLAA